MTKETSSNSQKYNAVSTFRNFINDVNMNVKIGKKTVSQASFVIFQIVRLAAQLFLIP